MLRAAPWLVLLLSGCEALTGRQPAPEAAPVGAAVLAEPGPLRAAIAAGVRRRSENEASYEIDAFVAALAVEELASGTGGVRVEPAFERGAQVGYRLGEVVPGSVYQLVGLRAGDVIEAIGEVRLDSPGRAAGLLGRLERGAQVTVSRDGVGFSLDLRIAGGLAWSELLRSRTGSTGQVAGDMPMGTGPLAQAPGDRLVAAEDGEPPAGPRDGEAGGTPVVPLGGAGSAPTAGSRPTSGAKQSSGGYGRGSGVSTGSTGASSSAGASTPAGKTGVQCASTFELHARQERVRRGGRRPGQARAAGVDLPGARRLQADPRGAGQHRSGAGVPRGRPDRVGQRGAPRRRHGGPGAVHGAREHAQLQRDLRAQRGAGEQVDRAAVSEQASQARRRGRGAGVRGAEGRMSSETCRIGHV
ncbi:hypothetical protein [Nannocystis pusilla]|uniref:hypothetical protein n=1 Tax=Nannocystis pusilla TaxID=889268 RepID=UPI003DA27694